MAEEEKKKSFWETLPGIITAIAALITAIAALVAAMNGGSKEGAAKSEAPAAAAAPPQSSAPPANDEAAELKRKLSEIAAAKAKAEAEAAAAKARAEEAERRAAEAERKKAEPPPVVQAKPAEAVAGRTIGQYIDHGDGTITDAKSGLMWKRCAEGLSGVNCEKGKTETYKWNDAVKRFKNIEYAGYKDWRMPSIDELTTLLQCSKGKDKDGGCNEESEEPTINQQAFPNTEATFYWSGSPYAGYSDYAWYVVFSDGFSSYDLRDGSSAVRLVRGGQ